MNTLVFSKERPAGRIITFMFFFRTPSRPPRLATWRHSRCLIGPTSSILTGLFGSWGKRERLRIQDCCSASPVPWPRAPGNPTAGSSPSSTSSSLAVPFSSCLLPTLFFSSPTVKSHFFFCVCLFCSALEEVSKRRGRAHGLCRNFLGHLFTTWHLQSILGVKHMHSIKIRAHLCHSLASEAPRQAPVK